MGYQLCCNAETIVHHCLHGPQTDVVMGQGSGEGTDKEYYGEENLVIVAAELGQGRERHIHRNKSLYIGCFLLYGLLRGFMLHWVSNNIGRVLLPFVSYAFDIPTYLAFEQHAHYTRKALIL